MDPVKIAYLTFLGPLLGSLSRPAGGWLADRLGGARVTFWNFAVMALAAAIVLAASRLKSLELFFVGFIALFVFSGIGNGSTYKMIPAIFRAKSRLEAEAGADAGSRPCARRLSGALIGIAGAIGAFGGVLVNLAFRQSFLATRPAMRPTSRSSPTTPSASPSPGGSTSAPPQSGCQAYSQRYPA